MKCALQWTVVILVGGLLGSASTPAWAQGGMPAAAPLGQPPVATQPQPLASQLLPSGNPTGGARPFAAPPALAYPSTAYPAPAANPPAWTAAPPAMTPATLGQVTPGGLGAGSSLGGGSSLGIGRGTLPTAPLTPVNPFASAQGYSTTTPATISSGVQRGRAGSGTSGRGGSSRPSKPYANFTPPSPVSPYMNLYRNDGVSGVNNYYSLVKPALDQRAYNQQTQREIQTLQTNTRTQSQMLNQLNVPANPTTLPQNSFQNLQNYYPGSEPISQ